MIKKFLCIILTVIAILGVATTCFASIAPIDVSPQITSEVQIASTGSKVMSLIFSIVTVVVVLGISLVVYLIPMIVAIKKNHPNKVAIILINIFLGWSFIGWVGALIWACIQSNQNNKYEELSRIQKLKEDGIITEAEFELEKMKILSK